MITSLLMNGVCACCLGRMRAPESASRFTSIAIPKADAAVSRARVQMPLSGRLRLEGGTIVNPHDGSLVEGMDILVSQGRIVALQPAGSAKSDPSAQTIDATGKFVVPGYNDMHSHVLELDNPSGGLALLLAQGVTGFRQMSGSPELLAARRSQTLPVGKGEPALLEMPGSVLTPMNASSSEAIVAEIASQKAQGADFMKVAFVSAPVLAVGIEAAKKAGIPILGHLQDGADPAASAEAGFKSVEHLGPGATVWVACSSAEAELKGDAKPIEIKAPPAWIPFLRQLIMWRFKTVLINPSAFVPPAYVAMMQRAFDTFDQSKFEALAARFVAEGTWHVPTLVRLRTQELADLPEYENDPFLRFMPKSSIKAWRGVTKKFKKLPAVTRQTYVEAYQRQQQLTKLLADAGVRMMTGSDGGWLSAPGLTLQEEFVQLAEAGLSPLKILQMTTINAAEYLDRAHTMGTVEPGRNADLVLLDANPLESVENLGRIAGVVRAGFHYSKQDLDALKERVAKGGGYLN